MAGSLAAQSLPDATVGVPYTFDFGDGLSSLIGVFDGITITLTYDASGGVPPGLALARSGLLSGTPTAAGQFNFNLNGLLVITFAEGGIPPFSIPFSSGLAADAGVFRGSWRRAPRRIELSTAQFGGVPSPARAPWPGCRTARIKELLDGACERARRAAIAPRNTPASAASPVQPVLLTRSAGGRVGKGPAGFPFAGVGVECAALLVRGGAVWQLVGLITRRS